jgi:class 3 adenylate cyclase/tetratricopeptide (TPR) repeat protein
MTCPRCKTENDDSADLCAACGAPLAYTPPHLAGTVLGSPSALEGERKPVTVLFCDVAGSTALAERIGPDAMHGILNAFFDLALREVHHQQGTVNQFLGDGLMALFGAPVAHEDHARRAVLAALAIQRQLTERGAALDPRRAVALRARVGLNTGLVVVGKIGDRLRMDYTAIGTTTNLAARLQQLAEPGTVLLSESTWRAVRDDVECRPLGARTVKGLADPVPVYQALAARPRSLGGGRRDSPLVGRESDLAALLGHVDALAGGTGAVVTVVGEAGIGKSRLLAEGRRHAAGHDLRWLEGRARSTGETIPCWPFVEIIRGVAGIEDGEPEAASFHRLEHLLGELAPEEAADLLPYLATLVGLTPRGEAAERVKRLDAQAVKSQILRASRRLFERLARERPLVLVLEDLHWVDQLSQEVLEHVLPLAASVPVLVVAASRADVTGPLDRLSEVATRTLRSRYAELRLAPLRDTDGARLVASLVGADELPAGLTDVILGRAEGNPFFLEQVVQALLDMRALVEMDGRWQLAQDLHALSIPDTLQGVILARIDRLDDDVKSVLKVASVIGRSFLHRVLDAVMASAESLDPHLTQLERVELIQERRRVPELEYVFKHALVQEATYETILLDRKRQLHRQVAECLEALFAERRDELSSVLAYHYSRAEDWDRAQAYLRAAGDQAGRIAADAEALTHYRQALDAYASAFGDRWDPVERATLERKIGEALFRRGEHDRALHHLHRTLELLGVTDPTSRWAVRLAIAGAGLRQAAHRVLPRVFVVAATDALAPAVAEECRVYEVRTWINYFVDPEWLVLDMLRLLNVSERQGNARGVAEGLAFAGMICGAVALHGLAGRYHRHAVAYAERVGDLQARGIAWFGLGYHEHLSLGRSRSALEHLRQAAAIFREAGDLRGWGAPAAMAAVALIQLGDFAAALAASRELIEAGREGGDRQVSGWGLLMQGWTWLSTGDVSGATSTLGEAAEVFAAIPAPGLVVEALGFLGQCHVRRGALEQAAAVLDRSERLIVQHRLRDHQVASTLVGRAATSLAVLEDARGAVRAEALARATRTCGALVDLARIVRPIDPPVARLRGTLHWMRGRREAAAKWWERSVVSAHRMEHRPEVGRTRLESGRRTGRRADLEEAERIFAEVGAGLDLAEARAALGGVDRSAATP